MYPINYCAFCGLKMIRDGREICLYYDLSDNEWAKKCPYYSQVYTGDLSE